MNLPFDKTTWTWFDLAWPWIGLAMAILLLILLFATNRFRHNLIPSRWRDPVWLSWLAIPVYMVHQFEEYGIDFSGHHHAFPNALCNNLGLGIYPNCLIPHEFFLFVNISLVWFFAIIAAKLSVRNHFVGFGLYSVIISNAMAHILPMVVKREYNPGAFTAVVIFLPSFIWLCKSCFGKNGFRKIGIPVLIVVGAIVHLILISSLLLFANGKINGAILDAVQIVNALMIVVLPWIGSKIFKIDQSQSIGP